MNDEKFNPVLVSISCATYNHAPFIRQCFEGFLMQKTNFSFEILIHDDASTDGTADIIREYEKNYPEIFFPIYQKENQYSKKNIKGINTTFNFPRAKGKYIALCEGDDYWTDPCKLQKQVDFLEANPNFNLCCHDWEVNTNGVITSSPVYYKYKEIKFFNFETLPWIWITKTNTLLYRNKVFDFSILQRYQYSRDVHIVYHLLKNGKGVFFPQIMSGYRIHDGGIWGQQNANKKNEVTAKLYQELYSLEPNKGTKRRCLYANLAFFNGLLYNNDKEYSTKNIWKIFFQSWHLISNVKDVIFYFGSLLPTKWVDYIRTTMG